MRNDYTAENTSLYQYLQKGIRMEIPMLQRDYAQGREDAKTKELRNYFIANLVSAIARKDRHCHLDYIYGAENENVFSPVDGQQRLTTLFLLHWYVSVKTGKFNEAQETLRRFTYKVRVTSQEFITALLDKVTDAETELTKNSLRDAAWYYSLWDYDPSVQGMLTMIDALDEYFAAESANLEVCWQNLTSPECPITFTLLAHPNLGADLYMRMNARGLPLSTFENFKAWLELHCNDFKELTHKQTWRNDLDSCWMELVWRFSDKDDDSHGNSMDQCYMRLFNSFAVCELASKVSSEKSQKNQAENLIKNIIHQNSDFHPVYTFGNGCESSFIDGFSAGSLDLAFGFLKNLTRNKDLELIRVGFDGVELYSFASLLKQQGEAKTIKAIVLAYALAKFLQQFPDHAELKRIEQWLRVTRNLIENTTINVRQFINAIQLVDTLIQAMKPYEGDVNQTLARQADLNPKSLKEPFAEEREKAKLIIDCGHTEWLSLIEEAENHGYFRGQIGFLLNDEKGGWLQSSEIEKLKVRSSNAFELFDKNGIKPLFKKRMLLLRAFVSRFDDWSQLWNLAYDNSDTTWRNSILVNRSAVYNESKLSAPLNEILNIENDLLEKLKEFIQRESRFTESVQKMVHEDIYRSELLIEASPSCRLRGWKNDNSLSGYIYYLHPHNKKGNWQYHVIGSVRNEIIHAIIQDNRYHLKWGNQLGTLPYFHSNSIIIEYRDQEFAWDWVDCISLEGNAIYLKDRPINSSSYAEWLRTIFDELIEA